MYNIRSHIIFFVLLAGVLPARSQTTESDRRRLQLQLAASFLNVASQTQIDLDSGVIIAARAFGFGASPVITEGFDKGFVSKYGGWIDKGNTVAAKVLMDGLRGGDLAGMETLLGAWYAFRTGLDEHAKDSAVYYLEKAKGMDGWWKRQALILLEKVWFEARDTTRGLSCMAAALEECRRDGDRRNEAKALSYEGSFYPFVINVLPRRIGALEKALPIYRELRDTANQVICLRYMGFMRLAAKDMGASTSAAEAAYQLGKAARMPSLYYIQDQLTFNYQVEDRIHETLKESISAMTEAEAAADTLTIPYFYVRIGDLLTNESVKLAYGGSDSSGKYFDALQYYWKALAQFERRHDITLISHIIRTITALLSSEGRYNEAVDLIQRVRGKFPFPSPIDRQNMALGLGEAYFSMKQYAQAQKAYEEVERLEVEAEKIRGDLLEAQICFRIGLFYYDTKQYSRARPILIRALSAPSNNLVFGQSKAAVCRYLSNIDSLSGNYASALTFLNQYTEFTDSLYNRTELKQMDSLRTLFAAAQKEKDNALLRAKSQLQEKELEKADLVRKVSFAGLILLLALVAVIFNRYQLKQKNNRQLELQKEEIDQKNQSLEKLVVSKQWLLNEIHHRVKNNLQIMMNLLNMQASRLNSEEAVTAVRDSQNRLHAMSLIHQKLYQTADMPLIDMKEYIREFVYYINDSWYRGSSVRLDLDLISIQLDITQAIPLGLILNEAVTNVYKYAFTASAVSDVKTLTISTVYQYETDMVELRIQDNGKGLPEDMIPATTNSLGLNLMRGLAEQMHGVFSIKSCKGVTVTVLFTPHVTLLS